MAVQQNVPAIPRQRERVTLADLTNVHLTASARLARAMRLEGASWGEIGREFGISQQAAHQRWARADRTAPEIQVSTTAAGRRACFGCPVTGLRWDPRRETPLQAAHRDRQVAEYLTERVAAAVGLT